MLSDPEKKAAYDRFGHAGIEGNFSSGGFQWSDFSHAWRFSRHFRRYFREFLRRRSAVARGVDEDKRRDLKIKVALTLEEIATGIKKNIALTRLQRCKSCEGSGAASGADRKACSTCGGRGQVQQMARNSLRAVDDYSDVSVLRRGGPHCVQSLSRVPGRGPRARPNDPDGADSRRRSEGNYIPLRGQGEVGPRGGSAGDCLVFIEEKEHDYFTRDGSHVIYQLPLGFGQAALGAEVEVPTLSGKAMLKIPAGTQSGRVFRMGGRGIPDVNGRGVGDQLVEVVLWTPEGLSRRERELFTELAQLEQVRVAREGESFFAKMRKAFRS